MIPSATRQPIFFIEQLSLLAINPDKLLSLRNCTI
jgi:hypothetical protein